MAEQTTPTEATEEQSAGIRIGDKTFPSPEDFTIGEGNVIYDRIGMTPQELIITVQSDPTHPRALQALAWVCLNRSLRVEVDWDDKKITESSIAMFFDIPEAEAGEGNPPASRQKRSSSAKPTT